MWVIGLGIWTPIIFVFDTVNFTNRVNMRPIYPITIINIISWLTPLVAIFIMSVQIIRILNEREQRRRMSTQNKLEVHLCELYRRHCQQPVVYAISDNNNNKNNIKYNVTKNVLVSSALAESVVTSIIEAVYRQRMRATNRLGTRRLTAKIRFILIIEPYLVQWLVSSSIQWLKKQLLTNGICARSNSYINLLHKFSHAICS